MVYANEKFDCESTIQMKYGANLFEKQWVALVTDHKQRTLSVAASRNATYIVDLCATIANSF